MEYIEKMLFEFAVMLNNYRRFESDEDVKNLIDQFLTSYDPYNQPERSKREDSEEQEEGCVCEELGNCHCSPCE